MEKRTIAIETNGIFMTTQEILVLREDLQSMINLVYTLTDKISDKTEIVSAYRSITNINKAILG